MNNKTWFEKIMDHYFKTNELPDKFIGITKGDIESGPNYIIGHDPIDEDSDGSLGVNKSLESYSFEIWDLSETPKNEYNNPNSKEVPPVNFDGKTKIWMEGYIATGEHGKAQIVASYNVDTFEEAIEMYMGKYPDEISSRNGKYYIWGCQLYDNEKDARKAFG